VSRHSPAAEIPALTSLRFLAAALVFLHHFRPVDPSWPVAVVAAHGHVGVTVFFVLSGFLITIRYSDALGRPDGVALGEYFRRRVARIVPLYWTVLAVSLIVSTGGLGISWQRLPEWLLLQGFLSRSIDDLAVPTSWTLTLEETFYLTAPLLFLLLRGGRAHGAMRLLACTIVLLAGGLALGRLVDADRFQFLGSTGELLRHTFFGRFVDFALGVWGGRLFLAGRVGRVWSQPLGHWAAAAASGLGMAMVFAGQAGMALAGGLESPRWAFAWAFNLLVGVGALVLIFGLTDPRSPLSRGLGLAPFVYLGRVSYALYLIQLTPLGKGLLYRLIPPGTPGFGLLLYIGMTLVSALLYELVEEPARRLVTRVWPGGRSSVPERREPRGRLTPAWVPVVVASVAALLQAAAWAAHRDAMGSLPPSLAETRRAATVLADRIVEWPADLLDSRARLQGLSYRVPIPERWMIGTVDDRRAPPSLFVYADGEGIPFERRVTEAVIGTSEAIAYMRGPRMTFVSLEVPGGTPLSRVTLVRQDPVLAGALHVRRVAASPWSLGAIGALGATAFAAACVAFRHWRPGLRASAALAFASCSAFVLAELHLQRWAPVIIVSEVLVLWLASRVLIRRRASREEQAAA
jgi:peptidoglycan/LPS O-acetylase OafA/YrhL